MKIFSLHILGKGASHLLVGIFLLASFGLYAQESPDTVSIPEIEYLEDVVEEADEEEEINPFILKSLIENRLDSFRLRQLSDSAINAFKSDEAFWYANAERKRKNIPAEKNNDLGWLRTLLWIVIVVAFIGVLLWYLALGDIGIFRGASKTIPLEENEEALTENIFAINYQKEIEKAIAAGNFRLAIRLHFLRLLKHLSEKNIIHYKHDRTNLDYLMQVHNTGYYKDFFRLTRDYEYAWYGKFEVKPEVYDMIRKDFESFTKKFGR